MKKALLAILCIVLIPATALAREKTLYDISDETVNLLEGFTVCLAPDSSCSETDFITLKSGAQNSLRDIVQLVKTGNARNMRMSTGQTGALIGTMQKLQSELLQAGSPAEACGAALQMIIFAWLSFLSALTSLLQPPTAVAAGMPLAGLAAFFVQTVPAALFSFITGIVFTLGALILYPACLF